ncbi:MAG TPA: ATP-binding protein [Holophaga sp.]|nr:ATP-binding protein [Holophaga sp.]
MPNPRPRIRPLLAFLSIPGWRWIPILGFLLLAACSLIQGAPRGVPLLLLGGGLAMALGPRPRRASSPDGLAEALLRASPHPVFTVDGDGNVAGAWNPAAERRLGLTREEAQGRPMPVSLTGRDDLPGLLQRALEGEVLAGLQGQAWAEGRAPFPVDLVLASAGPSGPILVILGEEASQQARIATLTTRLGEKSAFLEAVAQAGVLVWVLDMASGRMVHVASSARTLMGIGREQLLKEADLLFLALDPGHMDKLALAQAEAMAGQRSRFEAPLAGTREGRRVWTRWTLDQAGGLLRGVVEDLTEVQDLRDQLRQSEKMATLGGFLSAATHDFNNILMSLLGYNELLLMDPELRPEQKRRLEVMHRGASRGRSLALRLLRYVRQGPGEQKGCDVNELVQEVAALLEITSGKAIAFRPELGPDLPPVAMEASELHQVIMNLVVNARDAMPEGGTLSVRTRRTADGGPWVALEVRDTGGGIPAHLRDRIFDPFFTTKGEGKGTGLGLSVVKRIVTSHGGQIQCVEAGQGGTTFLVVLPAQMAPSDAGPG